MKKRDRKLLRDLLLVFVSVGLAVALVETHVIDGLLRMLNGGAGVGTIVASFIGGIFFTSIFTTPPAIAALGEIAQFTSPWIVAAVGACGSVIGDMIIFRFVKNDISSDITYLLSKLSKREKLLLHKLFQYKGLRWLMRLIGAMIIASPLPDELGIALLGLSRTKSSYIIPLSYTFNFIGIAVIGFVARSI